MNRYLTNLCVVLVLFAAVTSASATSYPGYTCTELVGLTYGGGPNAWAGTLLPNGTVIGGTEWAGRVWGRPPIRFVLGRAAGLSPTSTRPTIPSSTFGETTPGISSPINRAQSRLEWNHVRGNRQFEPELPDLSGVREQRRVGVRL